MGQGAKEVEEGGEVVDFSTEPGGGDTCGPRAEHPCGWVLGGEHHNDTRVFGKIPTVRALEYVTGTKKENKSREAPTARHVRSAATSPDRAPQLMGD